MNKYQKMGEIFDSVMSLRTPSVGITLFEKISDIPKEYEVREDDVMVCQVIGEARYYEKAVAATKDSANACAMGGASAGLYAPPPEMLDGTRNAGAWAMDADAAKNLMKGRMLMETGKYEAIGACPLKIIPNKPDVVQAFGTPEQMLGFVYSNIWDGGEQIGLSTNGHGASCNEVLTVPILTDKVRLAMADIGERRHAGCQDEMIVGIPHSQLERMAKLVENLSKTMYKYPFRQYLAPIPESVLKRVSTKY